MSHERDVHILNRRNRERGTSEAGCGDGREGKRGTSGAGSGGRGV